MHTLLTVDITGDSSDGWIHRLVTLPLASNIHVFVALTYTVLSLLSIVTAYRIYITWQAGTSDNTVMDIAKWVLGMILCIVLIAGLKSWVGLNPVPVSGVEFNFE